MNKQEQVQIDSQTLTHVLSKMLGMEVLRADHETQRLHGGTLGDVWLVTGIAETAGGAKETYRVVWKTQKKWERYGDPDSWRREYDLYASDLGTAFTDSFRWPVCFHAELHDDEVQLWIEYIDGTSNLDLTVEMYVQAAEELGRFQGKLYAEQPDFLQGLANLSKVEYMKNFYLHYRSWNEVYDYIRSEGCALPGHLCDMLIGIDENADGIFARIEKLPIVLCHRDFWVANIFHANGKIRLIDWDTTGWGYLGEDMASLIADEADVEHMAEYYRKCVSAYYKGFSEYADVSHSADHCVREMILLMFGYRLVEWYKFAESPEDKALHLNTLQRIYEMKE